MSGRYRMNQALRCLGSLTIGVAAFGLATLAADTQPVPPSGLARNVLTNQGVVLLAQAGYSEGFIIDIIHHKQTQFDVSPEGLAWLARMGLSERIVRSMVANERKEEETAIVPASVVVAPVATTYRTTNNSPAHALPASAPRTVQVAIPVNMPTPQPSPASWYVQDWSRDRWLVMPNLPRLIAESK